MIEQQGRVVLLKGNEAGVQIGVSSGCPACDAGKGCGAGIFAQLLRRKPVVVLVQNVIDVRPGQAVTLGIRENIFLRILLRLYLLPLLSALAGAAVGHQIASTLHTSAGMADGITLLGAALPFGLVLLLSRNSKWELPCHLNVKLLRVVLEPSPDADCQSDRAVTEY